MPCNGIRPKGAKRNEDTVDVCYLADLLSFTILHVLFVHVVFIQLQPVELEADSNSYKLIGKG